MAQMQLEGEVLSTVPFRYPEQEECDAIVAMTTSFNYRGGIRGFVDFTLGIEKYDVFSIPSFSKHAVRESKTVFNAIDIACKTHKVKSIIIFQHRDFHANGKSSRFKTLKEEDHFHKAGLIACRKKIHENYPEIQITLIYVTLTRDQLWMKFTEILQDGREKFRSFAPYRFKDVFTCETAVVRCLDWRLGAEQNDVVKKSLKIIASDLIGLPGASRVLLQKMGTAWKGLAVAVNKHGCEQIIIMHHADCRAYGCSSDFENAEAEEKFHRAEMDKLEILIMRKYPKIKRVIKIYARLIDLDTDFPKIQFVRY